MRTLGAQDVRQYVAIVSALFIKGSVGFCFRVFRCSLATRGTNQKPGTRLLIVRRVDGTGVLYLGSTWRRVCRGIDDGIDCGTASGVRVIYRPEPLQLGGAFFQLSRLFGKQKKKESSIVERAIYLYYICIDGRSFQGLRF